MGIYYKDVNIIGRSSGRSAVGATAYCRSEKMQSVAHAMYQRGERIIQEGDEIVHDYRAKGGVVHSEILLPENALPEFMDSEPFGTQLRRTKYVRTHSSHGKL